VTAARPELDVIEIAGASQPWSELGLRVDAGGAIALGGVRIRFGAPGSGIVGLGLRNFEPGQDLDGLRIGSSTAPPPEPVEHPLGATAVDHVVALTPDLERTARKLVAAGLDHRRTRDAGGGLSQAFFLLGPCLLELGGPAEGEPRFWGLTLVVDDLDAAGERLGDRLGGVKDAVQPGRRIATVRPEADLGVPVALMTPR
jgi:hypothetical protein